MPIINVHCKRQDFRRAGRAWNKGDNPVNTDEHSQDELDAMLAALDDDPMFTVTLEGDSEAAPADPPADQPGGTTPAIDPIDTLVTAIGLLEQGNENHWTKSGLPEIKALETITGLDINAAMRDRAFKIFSKK